MDAIGPFLTCIEGRWDVTHNDIAGAGDWAIISQPHHPNDLVFGQKRKWILIKFVGLV
jgi:hypothetical protein